MLPSNVKQTPRCIIMLDCNSYTYRHHSISQQYPHTPDRPLGSRLCVVAPESLPLPWPTSTSTLLHPLLYLCICFFLGGEAQITRTDHMNQATQGDRLLWVSVKMTMSNFCFIIQSKNTHLFCLSLSPLTLTATHRRVLAGVLGGITNGGAPCGARVCPAALASAASGS